MLIPRTSAQASGVGGVRCRAVAAAGMNRTARVRAKLTSKAIQTYRFRETSFRTAPECGERMLKTCQSCAKANVRNDTVTAASVDSFKTICAITNAPSVATAILRPCAMMLNQRGRVMIGFFGFRGGRFRMSSLPSHMANAKAGKTSVTRLRYRICNGRSGRANPNRTASPTIRTSLRLHDNR